MDILKLLDLQIQWRFSMIDDPKSLKDVWEWKEKAYEELSDYISIEDKVKRRIQIINQNIKTPDEMVLK